MWLGLLSWALINSQLKRCELEASQIWLGKSLPLGCPNAELQPSSVLPPGAHCA